MKIGRQDSETLVQLLFWLLPAAAIIAMGHAPQGMIYAFGGMNISSMDSVAGRRNKLKWFAIALCLMLAELALVTMAVPFPWTQFLVLPMVCFAIAFFGVLGHNGTVLGQIGLMTLLNCYLTLTVTGTGIYGWLAIAGLYYLGALLTAAACMVKAQFAYERTSSIIFADWLILLESLITVKINCLDSRRLTDFNNTYQLVRRIRAYRGELAGLLERSGSTRHNLLFVSAARLSDHLSGLFVDAKACEKLSEAERQFIYSALASIRDFFGNQRESLSKNPKNPDFPDIDMPEIGAADISCEDVVAVRSALNELQKLSAYDDCCQSPPVIIRSKERLLDSIKANLNPHSAIMHHAVKLSATAILSLAVGWTVFPDHYYYIILMALLMVKPYASATWQMFRWRLSSTVLALLLALGYLSFEPGRVVAGFSVVLCLAVARIYLRRYYLVFNFAQTMAITIFACAFMRIEVLWLAKIRFEYTLVGMALALVITLGVFPRWEIIYIRHDLAKIWRKQAGLLRNYLVNGSMDMQERLQSLRLLDEVYDSWRRMLEEPEGLRRNYEKFADTIYATVMIERLLLSLTVADYQINAADAQILTHICSRLENAAAVETGAESIVSLCFDAPDAEQNLFTSVVHLERFSRIIWNNVYRHRQCSNND